MSSSVEAFRAGRAAQFVVGLASVVMLHWSLKTLSPTLSWLEEPTFVQSLAAATALVTAGALVNVSHRIATSRRAHRRRERTGFHTAGTTDSDPES